MEATEGGLTFSPSDGETDGHKGHFPAHGVTIEETRWWWQRVWERETGSWHHPMRSAHEGTLETPNGKLVVARC